MILVTGGTGFIGAHLLLHLARQGHKVRALKRKDSPTGLTRKIFGYYTDNPDELLKMVEWVDGDLNDTVSLTEALEGCRQVYHAAAMVSFQHADKQKVIHTNIGGTANLVNACLAAGVEKLLYVSTIGALGRAVAKGIVNEQSHFQASKKNSVYSYSKYEAEKEVWRGQAEGLKVVVVNPSIVVGPGDWSHGSPQLFTTMWEGLKFYSIGSNGFIDVNDVATVMIQLMEGDFWGERFILSTENVTYRQFFEWMAGAMGMSPPAIKAGPLLSSVGWRLLKVRGWITGKKTGITRETSRTAAQTYKYSNRKLMEALKPQLMPVKKSVERTARFFMKDHPAK